MSYEKSVEALFVAFIASGVEGLLCGIFLVLASVALYLLLGRPGSRQPLSPRQRKSALPRPLIPGTVVLLLLIVAHWACTMARTAKLLKLSLDAAGWSSAEITAGLAGFRLAQTGILACVGLVTDALLMWRLWIVSSQSRIAVAPPVISWVAFAALTVVECLMLSKADGSATPWTVAKGGSVMLIQSRSICIDKSKLSHLLTLVIESAGLWASWSIFVLVCFLTGSYLLEFALHGCPAIGGIACILINVRVGLGRDTTPSPPASVDADARPVKGTTTNTTILGPLRFLRREDDDDDDDVDGVCQCRKMNVKVEAGSGVMGGLGDAKVGSQ
ncbi:hypothetical protein FA15DRAFT_653596 [Coprinopsis marcescibilis]|uniref:Uncharacterized protein n=1 Tax=Coprinopsis marcescibilis TaxID=230819 RepID=A0A5C3L482_COPMA|nr:hypothetical protein FA15DRAFT_653596 [Coprinopsis marcescibilis]